MSITIKRNTGWIGSGLDIQIKLNGQKVVSLRRNQEVELELPNDKAYIKATQVGTGSNEIEVKDGDILEIRTSTWHQISLPILILSLISKNYIPDILYFTLVLSAVISILLIRGLHIKILGRGHEF